MKKVNGISGIITLAVIVGLLAACDNNNGGETCSHMWGWVVTTAPTDFGDGEKTEICSKCGETRGKESVLATGMVQIPGGTFKMGSPADKAERSTEFVNDENYRTANEGNVTVSAFSIGKYLVTQAQYMEIIGVNPSYFFGNNLPAEMVSWYDAIVFCNKLSIKEGLNPAYSIEGKTNPTEWGDVPISNKATWDSVEVVAGSNGYRLPTEAQWEYACRAGTTTPFNTGNNITTSQANYNGNYPYNCNPAGEYIGKTTAVNIFAPNAYGLYDMHGNLFEWCWDWYTSSYDNAGENTNPAGAVAGYNRVIRGGSWFGCGGRNLRSAYRLDDYPYWRDADHGIRVVRP